MHAAATQFLANIPSPDRGVWYAGPVPIRAYALCIIVGIVLAIWWGERRLRARGGRAGTVTDVAVFAVPFGLVGGRLYHVATDWYKYFGPGRNPLDALAVWEGGLGIWGAVALGAVGAWIGCRRRGVSLGAFADAVAPGIAVAQAVGRLGNWFNQELYGGPTNVAWGLELYHRVDPTTGLPDPIAGVAMNDTPVAVVHPTFLYELVWNVLIAVFVVLVDRWRRLGHGKVFALYVAAYTVGRCVVELLRTDEATHIFGVRINVFTSVILFVLAVAYLALRRGGREDPAAVRGVPLPGEEDTAEADGAGGDRATSEESPASSSERAAGGAQRPEDVSATGGSSPGTAGSATGAEERERGDSGG